MTMDLSGAIITENPQPLFIRRQWYLSAEYVLPVLSLLNFLWALTSSIGGFGYTVGSGVWKSLQPNLYLFYEGYTYPYKATEFKLSGPGIPKIQWFYDSSKKIFTNPKGSSEISRFPWLSAEIKHLDLTLYDITEFIESIRYCSNETEIPSAEHVISAWSLDSGIVLDKVSQLQLSVINEEGDNKHIPLYDCYVCGN